ncbi:MAG: hypothetical protein CVV06_18640 [Gammaproteobacteria bacterium HGW-Gammaproteobacteria-10]|nr:MAG: hypothetical protein CVV13_14980 [Gammaproteobacteria bacterium HGW-Gammaproteobacteria-3]PKM34998.1 MAG: hypothetical protein CVV06_18640 [Gammaproteobacteria bacterium HGW-Gammaproteobacteria-10]
MKWRGTSLLGDEVGLAIVNSVTVCAKRRSWLTPLTYIPVGNAEDGQKNKSVAQVIKCMFLNH